jgi:hypothetical protein
LIKCLLERERETTINVDQIPTAITEDEGYESENDEIIRNESSTGWQYRLRSGSPLVMMSPNTLVTTSGLKLDNPLYKFVDVQMNQKIKVEPGLHSHMSDLNNVGTGEYVKQPTLKPNSGNHIHYDSDFVIVCILSVLRFPIL